MGRSTLNESFSNARIEHVKFSSYGNNSWENVVIIDGGAKSSGAKGARTNHFEQVLIFGGSSYSLVLNSVIGFYFSGGIYAASGSNPLSGAILINGSEETKSIGLLFNVHSTGYLNISNTHSMKYIASIGIASSKIDDNLIAIDADETVDKVQILSEVYGKYRLNWLNSSIIFSNGDIIKK